jgi:hypothetical protein
MCRIIRKYLSIMEKASSISRRDQAEAECCPTASGATAAI